MGLKTQVRTLDLLKKVIGGNINTLSYIDFKPEKAEFKKDRESTKLERATPESQGIASEYLLSFLEELTEHDEVMPHSIMIVRNGLVIAEGAYQPFDSEVWQITHSLSKSITGIAVGMAIQEGYFKLEDSIISIFNRTALPIIGKRKKEIKVEDLLKMSSGVSFNEIGSLIEKDWVNCFLDSPVAFEPGTQFAYNSMNTYMLSAIIKQTTGQGLVEFLKKRLLNPLGIENIYWEKCPMGIEKGGWGLFISLEDRTKIAQLLLNQGKWEGKQLISEKWIKEMTRKQMDTPKEMNQYGYGYQVWIGNRKGSYQFNGVLGQNTIIYPDLNMVISITSGNAELFVNSSLMDIMEKYFGGDELPFQDALPENRAAQEKLKRYLSQMYVEPNFVSGGQKRRVLSGWKKNKILNRAHFSEKGMDYPDNIETICNRTFQAEETDASILPLFVQCMQNNFSQGINELSFKRKDGHLWLHVIEGDMEFHLPVGFKHAAKSNVSFHGDSYLTNVWGKMTENEDGIPVLKIMFVFPEFTNYRVMKIFFYKDYLKIKMIENPDLQKVLDQAIGQLGFSLSANSIEAIKNLDIAQYKMNRMTEPEWNAIEKK